MRADDDGFVNNPKKIQRMIGASDDDCRLLIIKRFILTFDSGVIVIKHWRMANALRKDRYTPTTFQKELAQLKLEDNGCYTRLPDGCQAVATCLPQDRIGKDSINNNIYIVEQSPTVDVQVPAEQRSVQLESAVQVPASKKKKEVDVPVPASEDSKYPYKEIIDYLNQKTDKKFSCKSKDARRHIHARIDDGYTVDDFKRVIDVKAAEWKGNPEMDKYLRPSTLFGKKFEGYLNQKTFPKKQKSNKFNNFEPRKYDMDILEARLLNS